MGKTFQDLQPLPDDRVALGILDVADEADPAGVAFVGRVIETLCGRIGTKLMIDLADTKNMLPGIVQSRPARLHLQTCE